jgi:hypothetical protein
MIGVRVVLDNIASDQAIAANSPLVLESYAKKRW